VKKNLIAAGDSENFIAAGDRVADRPRFRAKKLIGE
jgi:hypothetical protein